MAMSQTAKNGYARIEEIFSSNGAGSLLKKEYGLRSTPEVFASQPAATSAYDRKGNGLFYCASAHKWAVVTGKSDVRILERVLGLNLIDSK